MRDLLKDYFENNEDWQYSNVDITTVHADGHICRVSFIYEDKREFEGTREKNNVAVGIWTVLAFVNRKIK